MFKKFCMMTLKFFLLIGMLSLTSCNGEEIPASIDEVTSDSEPLPILDGTVFEMLRDNPINFVQLSPPAIGEELVIMHTNMGDITLRFFPEEAPRAVENFLTHARNGYYDGVIFHRVIPNFMIQGGDPDGTGRGGESIWGEPFGFEPGFNVRHFRGALAMAHAGGAMNSQFYIVQAPAIDAGFRREFTARMAELDSPVGEFSDGTRVYLRDFHSAEELEYFIENGGTPHLDMLFSQQPHTVFGHVFEGMDVVDAIAAVSRSGDRPNEDVIIESFSFITHR